MHEPTHRARATVDLGAIRSNVELLRASAPGGRPDGRRQGRRLRPRSCGQRRCGARRRRHLARDGAARGGPRAAGRRGHRIACSPGCSTRPTRSRRRWPLTSTCPRARPGWSRPSSPQPGPPARTARLHLKVDTGLGRAGAPRADWPDLLAAARAAEAEGTVEVVGVWSHLAHADAPAHPTIDAQVRAFDEAVAVGRGRGPPPAGAAPRQLGGDPRPTRRPLRPRAPGARGLRAVADAGGVPGGSGSVCAPP